MNILLKYFCNIEIIGAEMHDNRGLSIFLTDEKYWICLSCLNDMDEHATCCNW